MIVRDSIDPGTDPTEIQATGKQPVHVEGDLIARARLQF